MFVYNLKFNDMKKLLVCLFLLGLIACNEKVGTENKQQSLIISQDFVKQKIMYPENTEFENDVVHEIVGTNQCNILAKFKTKNSFGVESEFVYKMTLSYKGGDWTDLNNWEFSKFIIENVVTGEQQSFSDKSVSSNNSNNHNISENSESDIYGKVDNIEFKLVESGPQFIRLSTSNKLSKNTMIKAVKELNLDSYNVIQFCTPDKPKRGQEYASRSGGEWYLFE